MSYGVRLKDIRFSEVVNELVKKYAIESIVETGTYFGDGSTCILAKTGLPVYTIECNVARAESARLNLRNVDNVVVFHGYSLSFRDLVSAVIMGDLEERGGVRVDFKQNAKEHYLRELVYGCPRGVEERLLPLLAENRQRQLVFLDSAGAVGLLEAQWVLALPEEQRKEKILILDDINHVKHWKSVEMVKECGFAFVDCGRFGYSVLHLNKIN